MNDDEYGWEGTWEAPGHGSYTIVLNGRELEPHEICDKLRFTSDLFQQNEALQHLIAELRAELQQYRDMFAGADVVKVE